MYGTLLYGSSLYNPAIFTILADTVREVTRCLLFQTSIIAGRTYTIDEPTLLRIAPLSKSQNTQFKFAIIVYKLDENNVLIPSPYDLSRDSLFLVVTNQNTESSLVFNAINSDEYENFCCVNIPAGTLEEGRYEAKLFNSINTIFGYFSFDVIES